MRSSRYRSRYSGYDRFPVKPTVGELQAKAALQRAKLARTGQAMNPVEVRGGGRKLATTWWGQAWCANLERYADYANRIGRGRSYLRNGMVLDLGVEAGRVAALVQGSRPTPYRSSIHISPLSAARRERVEAACRERIGSLADLLAGAFPKELEALFMEEGHGLFPEPSEIRFQCSCPDVASMCKHVAAVLYGIGVRFDQDAGLFFALRGIDPTALVGAAVKQRTEELLAKGGKPSKARAVVAETELADVFGIDLAEPAAAPVAEAVAAPAKPKRTAPRKPAARAAKKPAATAKSAGKATPATPAVKERAKSKKVDAR